VRKVKLLLQKEPNPDLEFTFDALSEHLQNYYYFGAFEGRVDESYKKNSQSSFRESLIDDLLNYEFNSESSRLAFFRMYFGKITLRSIINQATLTKKLNTLTNKELNVVYLSIPNNTNLVSDDQSMSDGSFHPRGPVEPLESDTEGNGLFQSKKKHWIKVNENPNPGLRDGEVLVGEGKYILNQRMLLGSGILELRHSRNRHLTNIKPQFVSKEARKLIGDVTSSIGKLNTSEYKKLHSQERYLVNAVLQKLKKADQLDNEDWDEQMQVLIGSWRAGNDSVLLRKSLRDAITFGIRVGRISRQLGNDM
jgi:hypothetical protein